MISMKNQNVPKAKAKSFLGPDMCSINTLDCHSRPMTFNLNEGNYAYSSGWGVFCTGITLLLLFFYAVEKLFVQDNLSFFTETSIYDPLGTFGEYDGFNLAFALTPYTGLINRIVEIREKEEKIQSLSKIDALKFCIRKMRKVKERIPWR